MPKVLFLIFLCWFATGASAQTSLANAAIASAHPLATAAGKSILDQGGNAFDAAVAVAAALAVVEPYSSGLGGGGFFLLHRAHDGKQVMLDARERAPLKATPRMYQDAAGQPLPQASLEGARAAAIPGLPAGLAHLAQRYGRLPLSQSLAPAIRLAQQGFPADARYLALVTTRRDLLQRQAEAAAQYLHDGRVPEANAPVLQKNLAKTLRKFAQQGARGFYRGAVAEELVRAVQAGGGIWQRADLARYRVVERRPIAFDYRGRGGSAFDKDQANYNPLTEMTDILDGMSALDVARAVVVGTSRGGIIAMMMGVGRPAVIAGVVLTFIDVTAITRAEERQRLLLAELQHRVRNTLGVVRSIARRSAETSSTVEEYASHLDGRLNAFARTQALVTRDPEGGVDLEYLVIEELLAYNAREGEQMRVSGPKVRFQPKAAETFALAVHELATNAAKYGALSVAQGEAAVAWWLESGRLVLEWRERGGPTVQTPTRKGFGSRFIAGAVTGELGGRLDHVFDPDGVRCRVDAPL